MGTLNQHFGDTVLGHKVMGNQTVRIASPAPPLPSPEEVAEGCALLATLPTDDDAPLPEPVAALPAPSRTPLSRNALFVGRDDDLRALAIALKSGGTVAVTTGIGGVGKTQLAVEFAHRYGRYFAGGVFWLSFADPANVEAVELLAAQLLGQRDKRVGRGIGMPVAFGECLENGKELLIADPNGQRVQGQRASDSISPVTTPLSLDSWQYDCIVERTALVLMNRPTTSSHLRHTVACLSAR